MFSRFLNSSKQSKPSGFSPPLVPENGPPLPRSNPPGAARGSSRPSVPRGHLPPAPQEEEYYEDPVLSTSFPQGTPPSPLGGGTGMIPEEEGYGEEPTDIYGELRSGRGMSWKAYRYYIQ